MDAIEAIRIADEQRVKRQVVNLLGSAFGVEQVYNDTDLVPSGGGRGDVTLSPTGAYALTGQPYSNLNATIGPAGVTVSTSMLIAVAVVAYLLLR